MLLCVSRSAPTASRLRRPRPLSSPPLLSDETPYHRSRTQKTTKSHEAEVTWQPECGGKIRANVAFKVDGRFPAQVSVVGEAVDIGGGGGKGRGGDARKGRRRATGSSAGADGGRRRSLSQEAASRGSGPYTSVRAVSAVASTWSCLCC